MNDIIKKALDCIESQLDTITVSSLSEQMNYSMFYLQRLFSLETGMGIKSYIRGRRLSKAAFDVKADDDKIIEIAYKYGYETPESFTKSFKKQHHQTPTEMKKNNFEMLLYPAYTSSSSLRRQERRMKVRIEEKNEIILVGKREIISLEAGENLKRIPELWDILNAKGEDRILFDINNGVIPGVMGVCIPLDESTMEYWIATTSDKLVEGYESLVVKQSRYAVFEAIGPVPGAITKTWNEIMTQWIPTSGYDVDGSLDYEVYPDEDPMATDHCAEIWIKLK